MEYIETETRNSSLPDLVEMLQKQFQTNLKSLSLVLKVIPDISTKGTFHLK